MAEEKPIGKDDPTPSVTSMIEATRSRGKFSGHGNAKGIAGYRDPKDNSYDGTCEFITEVGQSVSVNPPQGGFQQIAIAAAWENIKAKNGGLFGAVKKVAGAGVDLDLGCLYEMADGTRGAIQAFGEKFGDFNKPPFMQLSGDERTGNKKGEDESIFVNGTKWNEIKKILVYVYIYEGASNWKEVRPQIVIDVPGENDLVMALGNYDDVLDLCVIGELENVRGGIKLTNRSEYFPGHEEMDRAYGFGLEWGDGKK
jgi:tellurite resistance protein TerA